MIRKITDIIKDIIEVSPEDRIALLVLVNGLYCRVCGDTFALCLCKKSTHDSVAKAIKILENFRRDKK